MSGGLHMRVILCIATMTTVIWSDAATFAQVKDNSNIASYTIDATVMWRTYVTEAGFGSPRLTDLNGDGVLDIVVGTGKEFGLHPRSVTAIDGNHGRIIWKNDVFSRVFSTPTLIDIDRDGVDDVVIGVGNNYRVKKHLSELGNILNKRLEQAVTELNGDLFAYRGTDGKLLWSIRLANPDQSFPDTNFNTAIVGPDLDRDGTNDLIAIQSGGLDDKRPPARVYYVSSTTGRILSVFTAPDAREIYSVPALDRHGSEGDYRLVFGTGGEVLPGHLFSIDLHTWREYWRFSSTDKGFAPSAILHDFEGTSRRDVVVSSLEGKLVRLNGLSGQMMWEWAIDGFETYASPAIGSFNGRGALDVVAIFSEGTYPVYGTRAVIVWVDGTSGEQIAQRDFGVQAFASPVIIDLNDDGYDEAIINSNMNWDMGILGSPMAPLVKSQLAIFDGKEKLPIYTLNCKGFSAATPALFDVDGNHKMDIIHIYANNVMRIELNTPKIGVPRWNQFRGPNFNGVLK